MKLCNETITLYNAWHDPDADKDYWFGTVIRGVSWYDKYVVAMTGSGLRAAETYTIRIPLDADTEEKSYVDPMSYAEADNHGDTFTLRAGDIIVKGEAETEGMTPTLLNEQHFRCATILGVTDNRRAPNAPHFHIQGA